MADETRFVADAMLGKLTKWLRVMGIDVMYDPNATDAQLLQYGERGGRVVMTRDHRLMCRRGTVPRFYIESDYYHEQVRQVVQAFRLGDSIQAFSRCLQCNTLLCASSKPLVAARVPPYVQASQTIFKHCMICDRLYWGGTHRDQMLRQLQAMLNGLLTIAPETHR
jgi:uncharacterized protein with PIN domain